MRDFGYLLLSVMNMMIIADLVYVVPNIHMCNRIFIEYSNIHIITEYSTHDHSNLYDYPNLINYLMYILFLCKIILGIITSFFHFIIHIL